MAEVRQRAGKGEKVAAQPVNVDDDKKDLAAKVVTESGFVFHEWYMPWLLLIVSFLTRYWALAEPRGVVFDEYHFGRFVNQYCAGTYLFDIHPPLGKLVLLGVGKFFGYDHSVCAYNNIQDAYSPECKYLVLRATAAFFGSLTTPLVYRVTRNWGGGMWAGTFAACLFLFDNLNLTESRLVLIDSQLIFWCAAALTLAQEWWKRMNLEVDHLDPKTGALVTGRPMGRLERNLWCIAVGLVTSCAISIKWTGLATPGLIAVESFFGFFFLNRRPAPLLDLLKVLTVAFALYYTWFAIHFSLLPNTGDGDAFMRIEFQRTLVNNSNYDPLAPHPGYFNTFFQLNAEMLSANARIDVRHNWESVWWEWPLNLRGILYYSQDVGGAGGYTRSVYLLGNPLAIWLVAVGVALAFVCSVVYLRYRDTPPADGLPALGGAFGLFGAASGFCLWAYTLNLLPYILVNRSAFIYHYMPALFYGEIVTALLIEQLVHPRRMRAAFIALMLPIFACWLYYAPWVYGTPLSAEAHARRRWHKRWD